jgi:hypothetical protein
MFGMPGETEYYRPRPKPTPKPTIQTEDPENTSDQ